MVYILIYYISCNKFSCFMNIGLYQFSCSFLFLFNYFESEGKEGILASAHSWEESGDR